MIWKKVNEVYEVSEYGDVRSVDRYVKQKNRTYWVKGVKLIHNIDKGGYHRVGLSDGEKRVYRSVHRLVGICFVKGYEEHLDVNHKDGIKSNNHFSNLEWVTRSENMKHAVENGLVTHIFENSKTQRKKVTRIDKDGSKISFKSLREASNNDGISISYLSQILNGKRPQKEEYFWQFAVPVEEVTE